MQVYFLDKNSIEKLVIRWDKGMTNVTLEKDDFVLGQFGSIEELIEEQKFDLPDGRVLSVRFHEDTSDFAIKLDSEYLPGSIHHPAAKLKAPFQVFLLFGTANILLTLALAWYHKQPILGNPVLLGVGIGLLFIGMGWLIRKGSLVALILCTTVIGLSVLLLLWIWYLIGTTDVSALILRSTMLIYCITCFPKVNALRRYAQSKAEKTALLDGHSF